MMPIRFGGITVYKGAADQVKQAVEKHQAKNATSMFSSNNNEAIVLDGADMEKLLKDNYNVTYPAELRNKSIQEGEALIAANPELIDKLEAMANQIDIFDAMDKVQDYLATAEKNGGKDIEGKPIQRIPV